MGIGVVEVQKEHTLIPNQENGMATKNIQTLNLVVIVFMNILIFQNQAQRSLYKFKLKVVYGVAKELDLNIKNTKLFLI